MTKGEYRVGVMFNPSNNVHVGIIKENTALLIDCLDVDVDPDNDEAQRCKAIAQTKYEEAAMWGVKAMTKAPVFTDRGGETQLKDK